MAEESVRPNTISTRDLKRYLKESPFFCKIAELILCVVSVGLIVGPFNKLHQEDLNRVAVVYVSLCSYIIINGVLIINYLLGERTSKKIAITFSLVGAVLCCTAGFVLIHDWINFPKNLISQYLPRYSDQMAASGIFAIFATLVFLIDTYFINKYE